jgi:hypothetical protein
VLDAIREAEVLLPGDPVSEGTDPRWQAIIAIGEYIDSDPEEVWNFICRWGSHPQEDLRDAIATCLLEHILEHHFASFIARVEQLALAAPRFGATVQRCWQFGQAKKKINADRFARLCRRIQAKA